MTQEIPRSAHEEEKKKRRLLALFEGKASGISVIRKRSETSEDSLQHKPKHESHAFNESEMTCGYRFFNGIEGVFVC